MRQILRSRPGAPIRVFVLWSPILGNDNRAAAEKASGFLPDARVQHYWDLFSFASRAYTRQFRFPAGRVAWDVFVLYQPGAVWRDAPPPPAAWMQNLVFGVVGLVLMSRVDRR